MKSDWNLAILVDFSLFEKVHDPEIALLCCAERQIVQSVPLVLTSPCEKIHAPMWKIMCAKHSVSLTYSTIWGTHHGRIIDFPFDFDDFSYCSLQNRTMYKRTRRGWAGSPRVSSCERAQDLRCYIQRKRSREVGTAPRDTFNSLLPFFYNDIRHFASTKIRL